MPFTRNRALSPLLLLLLSLVWTLPSEAASVVHKSYQNPVHASRFFPKSRHPTYWEAALVNVPAHLPQPLPMAGGPARLQAFNNYFFAYRGGRQKIAESMRSLGSLKGQDVVALFQPATRYTYVVTDKQIIFTRIRKHGIKKGFSKHFVVANFAGIVRFAGECWINEAGRLVVDNNSGTYKPSPDLLDNMVRLLSENFETTVESEAHTPTKK